MSNNEDLLVAMTYADGRLTNFVKNAKVPDLKAIEIDQRLMEAGYSIIVDKRQEEFHIVDPKKIDFKKLNDKISKCLLE